MKDTTESVWKFIKAYTEREGYPPSYREIALMCDLSSTSVVAYHIRKLEEAGLVERMGQGRRLKVCHARTVILEAAPKPKPPTPALPPSQKGKGDKTPPPTAWRTGKKVYQVPRREYPFNGT